jgi:hypothetical protein
VAELAELADGGRLAALQVADEVPAEGVPVDVVLRAEVLRAVLAHHLDAGLGERGQVVDGHVLRRGNDGDRGADLLADALVALADLSR